MKQVSFTDPYAQDYAELARQQKLAEILSQQAQQPMGDTQMVSGWAIPKSPLEGINKVAQSALSAFAQHKTGEREKLLAEKVREGGKKDATDFMSALQGTPAKPSTYEADTFDDQDKQQLAMDMGTPAVAGDKQKALAIALGAGNPMVQQAGSSLMADMLKGPEGPKWNVQERYNPETGQKEKVMVDMNNPSNIMPFGGQAAVAGKIAPNGVAYDPYALTPGQTFNDPNKPFNADGTPNPEYQKYETTKAEKGATRVGINNITTQEGEQSKTYGGGLGDVRIDLQKAGFSAPSKIANLNRMEQLLDGVEGGKLAKPGMTIASAAKSLGVEIDPRLGDKEAAEALAVDMALKMKEPGTGPMTDKDFENFMTTVPSLAKTSGGRKQIIHTLRAKATRDMEIAKMAREYARTHNGVIDDGFLDEASGYMAKNPIFKQPVSSTTRARADQILGGGK